MRFILKTIYCMYLKLSTPDIVANRQIIGNLSQSDDKRAGVQSYKGGT